MNHSFVSLYCLVSSLSTVHSYHYSIHLVVLVIFLPFHLVIHIWYLLFNYPDSFISLCLHYFTISYRLFIGIFIHLCFSYPNSTAITVHPPVFQVPVLDVKFSY